MNYKKCQVQNLSGLNRRLYITTRRCLALPFISTIFMFYFYIASIRCCLKNIVNSLFQRCRLYNHVYNFIILIVEFHSRHIRINTIFLIFILNTIFDLNTNFKSANVKKSFATYLRNVILWNFGRSIFKYILEKQVKKQILLIKYSVR